MARGTELKNMFMYYVECKELLKRTLYLGKKYKYTQTIVNGMQIPSIIPLGRWCPCRSKTIVYISFTLTYIHVS